MSTVKEKRKEKYEKGSGKRVIISLFHLTATVNEKKKKKNMRKKTVKE